jgi:hypothetical protein
LIDLLVMGAGFIGTGLIGTEHIGTGGPALLRRRRPKVGSRPNDANRPIRRRRTGSPRGRRFFMPACRWACRRESGGRERVSNFGCSGARLGDPRSLGDEFSTGSSSLFNLPSR